MKTPFKKIISSLLLVIALNLILFGVAKAVAASQNYYGITTAQAEKTIVNGTPYWNAKLWSRSQSPAINYG
ncbi:MAG: hypothetical protein HXY38_06725 [Chloroflexi bacterium]|nr:hypothetical protein [Chloroflexota bacterium]